MYTVGENSSGMSPLFDGLGEVDLRRMSVVDVSRRGEDLWLVCSVGP